MLFICDSRRLLHDSEDDDDGVGDAGGTSVPLGTLQMTFRSEKGSRAAAHGSR